MKKRFLPNWTAISRNGKQRTKLCRLARLRLLSNTDADEEREGAGGGGGFGVGGWRGKGNKKSNNFSSYQVFFCFPYFRLFFYPATDSWPHVYLNCTLILTFSIAFYVISFSNKIWRPLWRFIVVIRWSKPNFLHFHPNMNCIQTITEGSI